MFVPALLTGNAVLYKPSEFATLTGLHIARLLHAAGVPADVFAPLIGGGEVGAALLEQPVDGVFFTGSAATGARIAAAVGPRMIRLQLELGGKDPTYVADDADPAGARPSRSPTAPCTTPARAAARSSASTCTSRSTTPSSTRFVDDGAGLQGRRPDATSGTYIGADHARAAARRARGPGRRRGRQGRARCAPAASGIERPGNWFEPTVLTDVDHTMALMREESFGPLIGIQKVDGDDEALALMNDTRYGLTAGVYTRDEARAAKLLARVNAGSVYWNCCDRVSPRLPWSGHGDSGVGVTLSTYGIQTFTRPGLAPAGSRLMALSLTPSPRGARCPDG